MVVVDLEGADGVDLVAKEIDTVGVFVAEGVDVEYAATKGKLAGLVDVVDLAEPQLAQTGAEIADHHRLALLQEQRAVVKVLARHHHLGQGLGMGNDVAGF